MKNKKLLRAAAALLVGGVGVAAAGCSCGRAGKTEKICSDCGTTKIVAIPATGEHTWDEGVSEDGMTTFTCTVCGETEKQDKETPACKHINVDDVGIDHRTGTCLDCGVCLQDLATSPVNVGDVASGWYRVDTEFSFDLECLSGSISYGNVIGATVTFMIPSWSAPSIDFDADMDDGYATMLNLAECGYLFSFSCTEWTYFYIGDTLTATLTIEDSDLNTYEGEISVSNMVFSRITRTISDYGVIEKLG